MKLILLFCGLLAATFPAALGAAASHDGKSSALKDAVILVIRHAEKPASGSGLTTEGNTRAKGYVKYFEKFTVEGRPLKLDYLVATADSKESHRPRLTLEPTSKKLGLAIDRRFANEQFQSLAAELRTRPHGKNILICWHHGEIPQLVQALGADAGKLFPKGKWPDEVFNWVIELRYDSEGRLAEAKRISEDF